jgi:hypothetical protein
MYSPKFGGFAIDKKRLRFVAIGMGLVFAVTVLLRIIMPTIF